MRILKSTFAVILFSTLMQANPGFVGRIEVSTRGLEKSLTFALNQGKPYLEQFMAGYRIPDSLVQGIAPRADRCTTTAMSEFGWFYPAWFVCWGFPAFFFKAWSEMFADGYTSALWPNPTRIDFHSMTVEELKIEGVAVTCTSTTTCAAKANISSLRISTDLDLFELNGGRKFFSGRNLLIALSGNTPAPQLTFALKMSADSAPSQSIIIDMENSKVLIPIGSTKISMRDGVISAEQAQHFDSEANSSWFSLLSGLANDYFFTYESINNRIVGLLEWCLKPSSIASLNALIRNQFQPFAVPYPNLDIQNFVDQWKLQSIATDLHFRMIDHYKADAKVAGEFDLKDQKKKLFELFEKVDRFADSFNQVTYGPYTKLLDNLAVDIAEVCAATITYASKCDDSDSKKWVKRLDEIRTACDQHSEKVKIAKHDLERRARAKGQHATFHLEQNSANSGIPLSYAVMSADFAKAPKVYDVVNDAGTPAYDFSFQVTVNAINEYLEKMYASGAFDFCIDYSNMDATCGGGSDDLKVKLHSAPTLVWSEERARFYIDADDIESEIKMIHGSNIFQSTTTETPQIKFYFDLQPGPNGFFLNLDVDGSLQQKSSWSSGRTLINKVKKMTLVHPLFAEYMIGIQLEDRLEDMTKGEWVLGEIPVTEKVKLPKIKIVKIISKPEFIKFYISFEPKT